VDTLVAVNVLNYLVGNIGREGGIVFNPAPAFGVPAHARQASYTDLVELAEDAARGDIEVLIVNDTNPVFTLPVAAQLAEALEAIPLIVSWSSFMDETTAMADLILPSHTYLESWADDVPEPGVGFSVGAISQPVVAPLYDTRATGDILISVARQSGLQGLFPWMSIKERLMDGWRQIYQRGAISGSADGFEGFWNSVLRAGVWGEQTRADQTPVALDESFISSIGVDAPEFEGSSEEYPYILHAYQSTSLHDGRGANLPWMQEFPDVLTSVVYGSWVELNPETARELGLVEGDIVEIESTAGRIRAPVYVYPAIRPDVVAMPIGQGHTSYGRYASNRGVNPIRILAPRVEASTGSLASAATRVRLTPTGRHVEITKTGGEARELGREIVQFASADNGRDINTALNSIPIKAVRT
jgi:anaerobic selenocysteine-containing dehydrogenase